MSAALKVPNSRVFQPPSGRTTTSQDGSMVISVEELARFGNGDPKQGRHDLRALLSADHAAPVHSGPTAKPATVRIAGPDDEGACFDLWLLEIRQNGEHVAPIDEAKVMANLQAGTRRRGSIVGVIDGPAGGPVAMVVLTPMQWHWSQGWFFQELSLYVHPDHRKSRHAVDLLNFSKWVSDQQSRGLGYRVHLLCGVLGAWRIQTKISLYRRRFQQIGAGFIYPAIPVKGD